MNEKKHYHVSSEYWDGPIDVEMNEETFADPERRLIAAISKVALEAKSRSLIPITTALLRNDQTLKFEPVSEIPVESELSAPPEEAIPIYKPDNESPWHKLGGLSPDEIQKLPPERRYFPRFRRS